MCVWGCWGVGYRSGQTAWLRFTTATSSHWVCPLLSVTHSLYFENLKGNRRRDFLAPHCASCTLPPSQMLPLLPEPPVPSKPSYSFPSRPGLFNKVGYDIYICITGCCFIYFLHVFFMVLMAFFSNPNLSGLPSEYDK